MIASLLLASIVAAAPSTPLPWYTFDDYPMKAFTEQWKGASAFELLVGTDGRPTACTITRSSGYATLDRQTCCRRAVLTARMRSALIGAW